MRKCKGYFLTGPKQRLRVTLPMSEINWDDVHEALKSNPKLNEDKARKILQNFISRVNGVINFDWFRHRILSKHDSLILFALCEYYSADVLTIVTSRELRSPLLNLRYRGEFEFDPFEKVEDESSMDLRGICNPSFFISIFSKDIRISTLWQALVFFLLVLVFGSLSYVVLVGFLLYAVSVIMLFIAEPQLMAHAATHQVSIGLALLCFLVALAGLSGRAFRNIWHLMQSQFLKKRP